MDISATKRRLLLVDPEVKSLQVLAVSLRKAGYDVETAESGERAMEKMLTHPPDLIISETALKGMDGFSFCAKVKRIEDLSKIPFLFISSQKSSETKIHGLELGAEDVLFKPVYIREISVRIKSVLSRLDREDLESKREGRTRFFGDLADVSVVDLVQIIDLNKKSGSVFFLLPSGKRGFLFFRDGRVVDAEVGKLSGLNAVYRLFSWVEGKFAVDFKPIRRPDTIDLPVTALLIEGMRRLDEGSRFQEELPDPHSVMDVDFRMLAEELAKLPDEVNAILRFCDGSRTLQEIIDDSDLPDLDSLSYLATLVRQKIMFVREVRASGEAGEQLLDFTRMISGEVGGSAGKEYSNSFATLAGSNADFESAYADQTTDQPDEPSTSAKTGEFEALESFGEALAQEIPFGDAGSPGDQEPSSLSPSLADGSKTEREPEAASRAESRKNTASMGLAEKLLSDDSEIRAMALGNTFSEGDAKVGVEEPTQRSTREYGSPGAEKTKSQESAKAAAVLTDEKNGLAPMPAKVVDWGSWEASKQAADSDGDAKGEKSRTETTGEKVPGIHRVPLATAKKAEARPKPNITKSASLPAKKTVSYRTWASLFSLFVVAGVGAFLLMRPVLQRKIQAVGPEKGSLEPSARKEATLRTVAMVDAKARKENSLKSLSAKTASRNECVELERKGKGSLKKALIACREALQAEPEAADLMVLLAGAELDRGRIQEAKSLARRALTAKPDFVEAWVYLGAAEQESGRTEEARSSYRKYLEKAPDGPYARELRAILKNM